MSSRWNHSICDDCWDKLNPGREPSRLFDGPEVCCFCGETHNSGILVRRHPDTHDLKCKGEHSN